MADDQTKIDDLFLACDLNLSGYIEREDLRELCSDLEITEDEIEDVFQQLDKDKDGVISQNDFAHGFESVAVLFTKKRKKSSTFNSGYLRQGSLEKKDAWTAFVDAHALAMNALSSESQEQVCELYQTLTTSENSLIVNKFEDIILGVIRDVRQQQLENERLEQSFRREKEQHERHLRELEEDMESQMHKVETVVRQKEQERAELERDEMKRELEAEIEKLSENLNKLHTLEVKAKKHLPSEEEAELKSKLNKLSSENRHLKGCLTDAQTNATLTRMDLNTIKSEYETKSRDLENQKQTLEDYINEHDNLSRQLHMLHEANKRMNDTNDDLRSALDCSTGHRRTGSASPLQLSRSCSILSSGTTSPPLDQSIRRYNGSYASSLAEEISHTESMIVADGGTPRGIAQQHQPALGEYSEEFGEHDSGHSTLRDVNELHSDEDNSLEEELRKAARKYIQGGIDPRFLDQDHSENLEYHMDSDLDGSERRSRPSSATSARSNLSTRSRRNKRRQLPVIPTKPKVEPEVPIVGDPERMYKVVLAGDAAVGKSSFIMRLCKGKFVPNLNSTLGVDFQTKTLNVDGKLIALQLWDTAGQERFRSIAKSYFRRADGVLLLYDCTYERSFINVRDWMESIQESSDKVLPMMMCANKTDLREDVGEDGKKCISFEDGQKLARECGSLFIETSAKEGDHITEAVTELARLLMTNEDLEVKSVGLQLHDISEKKKNPCCGALG
ncbi:unnamed protein product [Owenia fusiformis]|uniref:Uncharacterized protein n=1 Tax=Owenia fusiformis TaxID=6347 RepID=A0A8J1TXZ5_OWEFU|nr:unnamed protein product [Owenia fusiformis]